MGRVVLANRERPIMIEPRGNGLLGMTLRYAHEIRDAAEYFAELPKLTLPDEMLRITEHILDTKTENFDPAYLEDRYRTVLVEKLRDKQARKSVRNTVVTPSRENVINLMEALKRSLAAVPANAKIAKSRPRRSPAASKRASVKRQQVRAHKAS